MFTTRSHPVYAGLKALALVTCLSLTGIAGRVHAAEPEAPFVEKMADASLLPTLRKGGLVLYMRHGTTDNSRADRAPKVDLTDCNTQRVLNEEGRRLSVAVGQAIAKARIPVGEVIHSPMCRARDSAKLAFPHHALRQALDLAYTANLTTEEKKPVLALTRQLLSTPVAAGSNRVIVAHAPNLADLMGYFVKPEGTVVVLRPLGEGQFEYLGSIAPQAWSQLLP